MIIADDKGRAEFKFADKLVKVTDIIGRSIVVAEGSDDLGKGNQPMSKVFFFIRPFYLSFLFIFFIHPYFLKFSKGSFNNYVDKMRGEGVKKCLFLSPLRV